MTLSFFSPTSSKRVAKVPECLIIIDISSFKSRDAAAFTSENQLVAISSNISPDKAVEHEWISTKASPSPNVMMSYNNMLIGTLREI